QIKKHVLFNSRPLPFSAFLKDTNERSEMSGTRGSLLPTVLLRGHLFFLFPHVYFLYLH
ncbi:MAG: hypothetical protein ACI9K9_002169, partial [Neolewinella sp.]